MALSHHRYDAGGNAIVVSIPVDLKMVEPLAESDIVEDSVVEMENMALAVSPSVDAQVYVRQAVDQAISVAMVPPTAVSATAPETAIDMDDMSLSVTEAVTAQVFARRAVSQGIDLAMVEPTVQTETVPDTAIEMQDMSLSITDTVAARVFARRSVSQGIDVQMVEPTVDGVLPPSTAIEMDNISLSVNQNTSARTQTTRVVQKNVTVSVVEPSATITGGSTSINMDTISLSVGQSVQTQTQDVYQRTFFAGPLTASASQCNGSVCETVAENDNATDQDPTVGGQSLDVEYSTGSVTEHGSGTVTCQLLDSSNTVVASASDSFGGSADSNTTFSFSISAPNAAVTARILRNVVADSQSTTSTFGCDDVDCTSEVATINGSITLKTASP